VLQDVTEEARLREQLMERTRYAESIIDASIYRVAIIDRSQKIIAWNKRSEMITGLSKEDVIGKKFFDVLPLLQSDHEITEAIAASLEGRYIYIPPKRAAYSDGIFERFYVPLLDASGETYGVLNILHEVTDLVHKEEELSELNKILQVKNRELEQKHEEITHFSFVASHDLKEPLRKIHTFSDWLMEHETGRLSEAGKGYVERMNASVLRMELLIEDILVLTKIHSDQMKDSDVDLNAVLRKVLADMHETIRTTQAEITTDDLGFIKGNENQCFYLFKNLISNAIKFQRPGNIPHIKITISVVEGSRLGGDMSYNEFVEIGFFDNGFGFDNKYSRKIFQVFQRLHGRTEFDGTGIGLAICKKIMDNHEGIIKVESTVGEGSMFLCYFPVR
jgi:PAS domain S-box-containing protein